MASAGLGNNSNIINNVTTNVTPHLLRGLVIEAPLLPLEPDRATSAR